MQDGFYCYDFIDFTLIPRHVLQIQKIVCKCLPSTDLGCLILKEDGMQNDVKFHGDKTSALQKIS